LLFVIGPYKYDLQALTVDPPASAEGGFENPA
jgi:hypothetical protein